MEDLDFGCFTLEHRCGFILHQDTVKESIEGDLAGFEPQSLLRNKYQRKEDEKGGQPLLPAFKICFVDKSEKQFEPRCERAEGIPLTSLKEPEDFHSAAWRRSPHLQQVRCHYLSPCLYLRCSQT